jgi:nucleoside-diphosphate-sugar epimerase
MDGIVICVAPKHSGDNWSEYQKVFGEGIEHLVEYLKTRNAIKPLHITFISSTGVYGNYEGLIVNEDNKVDHSHPINQIITKAERAIMSLENGNTTTCVLRLGGLYGPGRDMVSWLKGSSGEQVNMNGDHASAWTSVVDAAEGIAFAYENKLSGVYNLVDDMQLSRRELGSLICDEEGLPPILWNVESTAVQRISDARVSNQKIKDAGYKLKHSTMLDTRSSARSRI